MHVPYLEFYNGFDLNNNGLFKEKFEKQKRHMLLGCLKVCLKAGGFRLNLEKNFVLFYLYAYLQVAIYKLYRILLHGLGNIGTSSLTQYMMIRSESFSGNHPRAFMRRRPF